MKPLVFRCAAATLMCLTFSVSPLRAADVKGTWAVGVHGGVYKLVLTDHSDAWTPGGFVNADVKYGMSSKFSVGVEGSWMRTHLADLSEQDDPDAGAGSSFDNIPDGPEQTGYIAGLIGEYQFKKDGSWSPYVVAGTGMYIWKWHDNEGNTLMSDDPELDNPLAGTAAVPDVDLAGNPYELKDQELYLMGGAGIEFFPSDLLSFELGIKFRYLTHLFTSFTDEKDIVGGDPGELDLPRGIAEAFLGVTLHFGGSCPDASAAASGSPSSGPVPLDVQFDGSVMGGCPEYTYLWDFGDGTTSTEQNPRHTYATEGNYTASLTVKDSKDNPALSSVSIAASCPPLDATPSANPTGGEAPLTVNFQVTTSGGCPPLTYAWDFGDGATSAEQNPSHTFQTDGNITASLTVTDAKGGTAQKSVSVGVTPSFVPTPDKPVVLEGVNFEYNKAVLLPESVEILNRVATSLLAHPEVNVEVGGHCDSDGSASYNQRLSQRRADAVREYLIKMGLPAAQLTARGYGETQPVADNATPEGKAKNRRVELKRM